MKFYLKLALGIRLFTYSLCGVSAQTYQLTDLGAPLGGNSYAHGINNQGQVVGYWQTTNGVRAFIFSSGVMTDLGALGGTNAYALSINNRGQVAGFSETAEGVRAFLLGDAGMTSLGPLGGLNSYAFGINANAQIVGHIDTADGARAFLHSGGIVTNLGTLGGTNSYAYGINIFTQVAGSSATAGGAGTQAFLWRNGVLTNLNNLVPANSGWELQEARGINDRGQVAGWGILSGQERGFLYRSGQVNDLGVLSGGTNSYALGLNNSNQVVGVSTIANGAMHAFIWNNGALADLNELLAAGSAWDLREARGINDFGQVVGWGVIDGEERAFLLTPQTNGSSTASPGADAPSSSATANTPPTVSITSPTNNAAFSVPTNITINATASDSDGTVTQVQFFAGALLLGTDTTSPYSIVWNNAPTGTHTLTARATDNSGETATSTTVTITIATNLAPVADAYVADGSSASTNFGTNSTLQVRTDSAGNNRDAYFRFDLSGVTNLSKVKLRLWAAVSANATLNTTVYAVTNTTWIESGTGSITWNNRPGLGAALTNASESGTTFKWYEWDVTSYARSEKAAGRNLISLGLHDTATSNRYLQINSKEASANKPQLSVTTTNTAPTVSLTYPPNNALFAPPASFTLMASAADADGTINQVEFFQGTNSLGIDSTSPYSLTWSNVFTGAYALTARAMDNLGMVSTSSVVNILVDASPTVAITTPTNGAIFAPSANIDIAATAADTDGAGLLLDVDFGVGTTSPKAGFAVTGQTTNDFWNLYSRDDGNGGYRTFGAMTNLTWADGTTSAVGLTVANAPGAWQNGTADPMFNVYLYPFDGGNITVTITNLPVGQYDMYLYGHGGPGVDSANSAFQVVSESNDYGTKSTTTTSGWTSPDWQEGQQYVVFRDVAVVNAGGSVTITVFPGAYAQAFISGMQILQVSTVGQVEFFQGTNSLGIDTTSPYGLTWTNAPTGAYSLTARATDNWGLMATSSVVNILVDARPTVALTSPANGAIFVAPAAISLAASAADADGTVTVVEFFQGSTSLGVVTTPPYTLTWSNVAGGNFILTARATDNFGLVSTSGVASITVDVPPTVSMTSPANNSVFIASANVTLQASASDSDGSIAKVEFFEAGTNKLGEATVSPYTVQWMNVASGTYSLTARATDNLGTVSTSGVVNVSVSGSPTGDSDGDGLPDSWEIQYFGNFTSQNGSGDPDGDGLTNMEEFKLGTDPTQPNVASVSFNPAGGNYASPQSVAITCPTAGAAIHYTTTGQEPTESDPAINSGSAIPVDQNLTLKAKAWKTGWVPSDTESEGYQITTTPVNLPPTLTVAPASGTTFLASDDAEILVEASDSDGTISKIQLFRGDFKIAETTSSPLRYLLENMAAGTYTFTAKAIDNAGAVTASSPVSITVNASGPVVSLQGAQVYFTSSPGTLIANVVGVDTGGLTALTLNGSPLPLKTGDFTLSANLVEGENEFTLLATDNQNRSAQATTKVYLDSTRPAISITSPPDNSTFGTARINVQGTCTESSLKRITVNGVLAFVSGTTFEARNVPLVAGDNTITATAEDLAGNTETASVTVTGTPDGNGNLTDPVQLQAAPVGGFAPLNVSLTPQASVPGTIQQVLYDFDGDNITDQTATDLSPIAHTYTSAGQYFPVVTIQTSAGRFSSLGGWNAGPALRINVQQPPVQQSVINVADPVDIKVGGPASHLYVLSRSSATITEFDANGTSVRSLAAIGTTPTGLDVDGAGNVYVALNGDNQVAKFNATTTSFQLDTTFGAGGRIGKSDQTSGTGNGEFNAPFDVAVSPDGTEIAVSDSANNRIERFAASDGAFVGTFGQQGNDVGQFNTPKGLTYDGPGHLYIVDSGNNRIALALSSAIIGTSGSLGTALGQFQGAVNLGVGTRGVYVAETGNNRIQSFNPIVGGRGNSPTPFNARLALSVELGLNQPNAVAPVADFLAEKIFIADTANNRVIKTTLPESATPDAEWNAMKSSLLAGNIDAAIQYFVSVAADNYRKAFLSIGTTDLGPIMQQIPDLTPVVIESDTAQYRFDQVIEGITISFPVEFMKENGTWKILEY